MLPAPYSMKFPKLGMCDIDALFMSEHSTVIVSNLTTYQSLHLLWPIANEASLENQYLPGTSPL